jgi:hypothetical protein
MPRDAVRPRAAPETVHLEMPVEMTLADPTQGFKRNFRLTISSTNLF